MSETLIALSRALDGANNVVVLLLGVARDEDNVPRYANGFRVGREPGLDIKDETSLAVEINGDLCLPLRPEVAEKIAQANRLSFRLSSSATIVAILKVARSMPIVELYGCDLGSITLLAPYGLAGLNLAYVRVDRITIPSGRLASLTLRLPFDTSTLRAVKASFKSIFVDGWGQHMRADDIKRLPFQDPGIGLFMNRAKLSGRGLWQALNLPVQALRFFETWVFGALDILRTASPNPTITSVDLDVCGVTPKAVRWILGALPSVSDVSLPAVSLTAPTVAVLAGITELQTLDISRCDALSVKNAEVVGQVSLVVAGERHKRRRKELARVFPNAEVRFNP